MTQYGLEENEIAAIKNILAQHEEVEQAILYGSRAKGNFKPASDIDLVLKGEKLNVTIQSCIADELDDLLLPYKFDLSVFHQISNEDLLEHIARVGAVLFERELKKRSKNLKTRKWGELVTLEYGKSLRDYKGSNGNVPVYGTNGPIGYTDKALCKHPGVIVGRKGAYRGVHYSDKPFFVIDTAFYIKPKTNEIDLKFAYYQLLTQDISGMDSGSAIPSTSREDFYNLEVRLPDLSDQKKIASILSSLDNKIELNRQTNQTLEEIAKTLFQEMCVPKGDELPEGWRIGKLGDVCRNVRRTVNPQVVGPNTPYVGLEHIPRRSLTLDEYGDSEDVNSQKSYFEQYHILFGKLRPYFHKVCIAPVAGICSTDILVIEPVHNDYFSFCLNHLFSDELIRYVSSVADGTRMPRVDWKSINNYDIFIPDAKTLKKLNDICFPNYKKMIQNAVECVGLAKVRDSMLPKLLNGSIFVEN